MAMNVPSMTNHDQKISKSPADNEFRISSATFKHFQECFDSFPNSEIWRLFIDGVKQQNPKELGFWEYENRQKGSVKGLLKAFQYLTAHLESSINSDLLLLLHKLAHEHVVIAKGDRNFQVIAGQYRHENVHFELTIGGNATFNGLEYLKIIAEQKKWFQITTQSNSTAKFLTLIDNPSKIKHEIDTIFIYYNNLQPQMKNTEEKLHLIIITIQNLIFIHPFSDGNCRTCIILLMNLMLLQNKLNPVILDDPNFFRGHAPYELMYEMLKGELNFKFVKKHHHFPNSITTANIIHQINQGLHPHEPLIHWLASFDDPELLKLAIDTEPSIINKKDLFGNSPLITAAFFGNLNNVKLLISQLAPAQINYSGQFGGTALFWACFAKNYAVAEYLLENHADPNIISEFNSCPLQLAYEQKQENLIALLEPITNLKLLKNWNPTLENFINVFRKYQKSQFANYIPDVINRQNINLFTSLIQRCLPNQMNLFEIIDCTLILHGLTDKLVHHDHLTNKLDQYIIENISIFKIPDSHEPNRMTNKIAEYKLKFKKFGLPDSNGAADTEAGHNISLKILFNALENSAG